MTKKRKEKNHFNLYFRNASREEAHLFLKSKIHPNVEIVDYSDNFFANISAKRSDSIIAIAINKDEYYFKTYYNLKRLSKTNKIIGVIYDESFFKKGRRKTAFFSSLYFLAHNITLKPQRLTLAITLLSLLVLSFGVLASYEGTKSFVNTALLYDSISETITKKTQKYSDWKIQFKDGDSANINNQFVEETFLMHSHYQATKLKTYYDIKVFTHYYDKINDLNLITMPSDLSIIYPDYCYYDLKVLTSQKFYGYRYSSSNCVITKSLADEIISEQDYDLALKKELDVQTNETNKKLLITAVVDDFDESFSYFKENFGQRCVFVHQDINIENNYLTHIISQGKKGAQIATIKRLMSRRENIHSIDIVFPETNQQSINLFAEVDNVTGYNQEVLHIVLAPCLILFFIIFSAAIGFLLSFPLKRIKTKINGLLLLLLLEIVFFQLMFFIEKILPSLTITSTISMPLSNSVSAIILFAGFIIAIIIGSLNYLILKKNETYKNSMILSSFEEINI